MPDDLWITLPIQFLAETSTEVTLTREIFATAEWQRLHADPYLAPGVMPLKNSPGFAALKRLLPRCKTITPLLTAFASPNLLPTQATLPARDGLVVAVRPSYTPPDHGDALPPLMRPPEPLCGVPLAVSPLGPNPEDPFTSTAGRFLLPTLDDAERAALLQALADPVFAVPFAPPVLAYDPLTFAPIAEAAWSLRPRPGSQRRAAYDRDLLQATAQAGWQWRLLVDAWRFRFGSPTLRRFLSPASRTTATRYSASPVWDADSAQLVPGPTR